MGTLENINAEIFNLENVYPYEDVHIRDITSEGLGAELKANVFSGMKHLGKLSISLGNYINNRKKYALEFIASLGPKVYNILITLKDGKVEFKDDLAKTHGKKFAVWGVAGIESKLPTNYHEFYLALLNILAIKMERDIGITIKTRGNGKIILDNDYNKIVDLIKMKKINVDEKLGKICYPIMINKDKVKFVTVTEEGYVIVNGVLDKKLYETNRVDEIDVTAFKETLKEEHIYLKSYGGKIGKIVEVMADMRDFIDDVDNGKVIVDDLTKLMKYIKDMRDLLLVGDIIISNIHSVILMHEMIGTSIARQQGKANAERMIKEVNS